MRNTTLCYIEKDGKYLMLLRNKKQRDVNEGKWIGIGGHVEEGESVNECLVREVREETGLEIKGFEPRGIIDFISEGYEAERMFLYTSREFEGTLEPVSRDGFIEYADDSCSEGTLAWVPKDKVNELNLWEGDRIFLQKLADDEGFFFMELAYRGDELVRTVIGGRNFDEKVYEQVARIPKGRTSTYGEIACLAGYPGAARAVGNALHRNPYDGFIPCHRVLNKKGEPTAAFVFGGADEQIRRLAEEGVTVKSPKKR